MKKEWVEYSHGEAVLEAYVAYNESEEKRPGVLIFHAWQGRDDFVCKKAEMLANFGYVGFALDLYGKGVLGGSVEENMELMNPFIADRQFLLERMGAGLGAVLKHPMVDKERLGAIGFCFGGLCALDLARSGAPLKGVVSFHGLLDPPEGVKRGAIDAKILVLHGHDDPMVVPEQVLAFEKEMVGFSVDWQVHVYGKTMHAFTNPVANDRNLGTVYSPIGEKRAFRAMQNFFCEIF